MWYVIQDEDGPFLTNDEPAETDIVLFQGNIVQANRALERAINAWENEHEDMNEDFE
jgi:hypothetical protein